MGGVGVVLHPAMLHDPLAHGLDVNPVGIIQRAVPFDDPNDPRTVFLAQELGSVVAHIPQPLHNNPLAVQRAGQPGLLDIFGVAEELA